MEDKIAQDFIKSALELGQELLDKDNLTEKEEKFLLELDKVTKSVEG
jgi:hypothetical protein